MSGAPVWLIKYFHLNISSYFRWKLCSALENMRDPLLSISIHWKHHPLLLTIPPLFYPECLYEETALRLLAQPIQVSLSRPEVLVVDIDRTPAAIENIEETYIQKENPNICLQP